MDEDDSDPFANLEDEEELDSNKKVIEEDTYYKLLCYLLIIV